MLSLLVSSDVASQHLFTTHTHLAWLYGAGLDFFLTVVEIVVVNVLLLGNDNEFRFAHLDVWGWLEADQAALPPVDPQVR